MKITKTASGKQEVRMTQSEWKTIGKKAGWDDKEDDTPDNFPYGEDGDLESGLDELQKQHQTSVAETILQQLGGNKFAMMTGAKNFTSTQDGLSFRLPGGGGFTKDGINYVHITLSPMDTYNMEFGKMRGNNYKIITTKLDIYSDMLQEVFRDVTGLDTSL